MKKLLLGSLFLIAAAGLVYVLRMRNPPPDTPTAPRLSIMYNAEEQPSEKSPVAQTLQAQLQAQGLNVSLEPVPSATFNERIGTGRFQAALSLWYLDYDDAEGFLTDFYSKAGFRMSKYSNPAYDAAYESGLFADTPELKSRHFREAMVILSKDLPWIPLFSNDELFLMRKQAVGFRSNAYQYYDYRRVDLPDIRTATDVEIQTFDPAQAYDLASKHVVTQSYEGLVAMDANNRIVPALATDWLWDTDKRGIVFNLRPGVTFAAASPLPGRAGRTVDAGDVKASFERLLKTNSPYTYIFDQVEGVSEFKNGKAAHVSGFLAENTLRFRVRLIRPFPTLLPWLLAPAASVLPKELPEKYDFSRGSVGTGPFVLRSWNGSVAQFNANDGYWSKDNGRSLPIARGLRINVLRDSSAARLALQRGELDILSVPLALYDGLFGADGRLSQDWNAFELRPVPLNNLKFLAFNMAASPWGTDGSLRRRVADAIDRDTILRGLLKGHGRATTSFVPEGVAGLTE